MSQISRKNYELELHDFKNSLPENLTPESQALAESIIESIKCGFRKVGVLPREVHTLTEQNTEGLMINGQYDRLTERIGVISVEELMETCETVEEIQLKIMAVLTHESRHKNSDISAKNRKENGYITKHLGGENEILLQELMASHETEKHDAYGDVRIRAKSLCEKMGIKPEKIIDWLHQGKERQIVTESKYHKTPYRELKPEK